MKLKFITLTTIISLCNITYGYSMNIELDSFNGYHGDFSSYSTVVECALGEDQTKKISLIRGDTFYKGYFYAIDTGESIDPVGKFFIYNKEDDRDFGKSYSDNVFAGCIGGDEKVLVIFGDFGGNRYDAMALRYNEFFNEYEHIDIRTKDVPSLIYINKKDILLIINEHSPSGDKKIYRIGKYIGGKGQIDPNTAAQMFHEMELPKQQGYTVIPVNLKRLEN